jgi:hypothetical protein
MADARFSKLGLFGPEVNFIRRFVIHCQSPHASYDNTGRYSSEKCGSAAIDPPPRHSVGHPGKPTVVVTPTQTGLCMTMMGV